MQYFNLVYDYPFRIFLLLLSFPISRPFYSRYLLHCIFFLYIRVHTSTYEYIRVHTSTYEYIRVTYKYIRVTYEYIQVTYTSNIRVLTTLLFFGHFILSKNNKQTAGYKHNETTHVVKILTYELDVSYASTYIFRSNGYQNYS